MSPRLSSANRHAAPRAHRTVPDATRAAHARRRTACPAYFTRPAASRTRSAHSDEQ
jgi:hypothetical protein